MLTECILFSFFLYILVRLSACINKSGSCLVGKTAIVTGANSGIGYHTALGLASRGCRVIMADVADMETSKNNIIKFTNNHEIIAKKLDLTSCQAVRDFAKEITETEDRLDILINNAAIASSKEKTSEDGLHPVMQVNYFSHFLLTHLLTNLLKMSAPSRIIFTGSFVSFCNNLSVENLNYDDSSDDFCTRIRIYANSKFATLIASDIFAKKLDGTGVTSNCVNPGVTYVHKSFVHTYKPVAQFLVLVVKLLGKNPWEGAQPLVHAAISKQHETTSGKHFWKCRPFLKPLGAYNEKFCKKIWYTTEKCVCLESNEKL